jgi:FkbM family methyltransferase
MKAPQQVFFSALDLYGRLPYFRGKGRLVVWLLRLLRSSGPLPIRLPDQSRILMTQQSLELLAYFWLGKHQPEFTKTFWQILCTLPAGHSVIDVGAHIGYYSLMAAHRLRQIGAGLVFAFEPHPINFADLQRNQQLNNMSNLILIQKAVADQTTQMRLFSSPLSGAHSLRQFPFHNDSYEVESITLDDFMVHYSTIKIGLLKIDVEGAELLTLRGAQQLLERDRPLVIYEESKERCRFFNYTTTESRRFMNEIEYDLYQVDDFEIFSDVLAIPKEKRSAFLQNTTKFLQIK